MKIKSLKKLIKTVIKEAVMSQHTPAIKTPNDAFFRYLYFVFNPVVLKLGKGKIQEEPQVGTLSWELPFTYKGKSYDRFYASPCWEGDDEKMIVQANDNRGTFDFVGEIPFPMKDWTMDANKDAKRYIEAVTNYLKSSGFKFVKRETMSAVNLQETEDEDKIPGKFVERGEVKLDGGMPENEAKRIANWHWDIFGQQLGVNNVWHFMTRGGRFCCSVGYLNGKPAILSVTTTPGRLQLLVGDEALPKKENGVSEGLHDPKPCNCGSGEMSQWVSDAQGIPLCRVCPKCKEKKLSRYRPEILKGYDQSDVDEPIEPDELEEMTSTGAVAGYSTPFAFTKNKKGSSKGIAAAKKYGKVVGESEKK